MKNLLFVRIPSICICFTLITLFDVIFALLAGYNTSPYLLGLFLWLAACQLIDQLMGKIDFRKWSHYCAAETIILYVLSLLVFRVFFWEEMELSNLLPFTIIFLITIIFVFWYFRRRQELQANEINELLERNRK